MKFEFAGKAPLIVVEARLNNACKEYRVIINYPKREMSSEKEDELERWMAMQRR